MNVVHILDENYIWRSYRWHASLKLTIGLKVEMQLGLYKQYEWYIYKARMMNTHTLSIFCNP